VDIYLPVGETSINLLTFLGLGGVVGLLSGLFGVGGGFLLTPLLIMMGIPPTVAAASDSNQIVASSSSGAVAHSRAGNVDFKMGTLLLLGSFPGGAIGVQIIKVLRSLGEADFFIKVIYILVLGGIGSFMFADGLKQLRGGPRLEVVSRKPKRPSIYVRLVDLLPFKTEFPHSKITLSPLIPFLLGMTIGMLAAIMGVGGGFIMVPAMVYLLRMPMHGAIGTDLFQIVFACINVTVLQAYVNHTVDFVLALTLLAGSVFGAQIGARISGYLRGEQLKIILSVIVILVMVKMLLGLLLRPDVLLAHKGGHGGSEHSVVRIEEAEAKSVAGKEELAPGVEFSVDPKQVDINMRYGGQDVEVQAEIPADFDVAVKCVGPIRRLELKRKGKVRGLLWMSVGDVAFEDAPEFYALRTSAPLGSAIPLEERERVILGYDGLSSALCTPDASPDARDYFRDLVKLNERDGLFSVEESTVELSPLSEGTQRVVAGFELPGRAPATDYRVELYGLRDGHATLLGARNLSVQKVGAVAFISSMAKEQGLLYGVMAAVVALAAGLGIGLVFRGAKGH